MRYLLLLSSLLLSLSAEAARPIRVCIIGDSIFRGVSPSSYGVDVPLNQLGVNAGLDFATKNIADPSDVVADASTLVDREVIGRNCTHAVLLIGTNNLTNGDSAATVYSAIDTLSASLETAGVRVIECSTLPRITFAVASSDLETRRKTLNTSLSARSGSIFADTSAAVTGTASGTAWADLTAYSLNDVRVNGGKAYIVTTAGTSAGSGGPTGTGTGITDGSVVWDYAPALGTEYGGAQDGLHPNNAGQQAMASTINAAVVAAGGWAATALR